MTRIAATRLAADNIRVNAIQPGLIATAIFGRALGLDQKTSEDKAEQVKALGAMMQPLPRAGEGVDIANAAVFLASEEARFVTGRSITVDGGLTAGQVPPADGGVFKPLADLFGVDLSEPGAA